MPAPILILIGGANKTGKTTFARAYLTREMKGLRFLNADEIARGLSPFDVDSVAFKAGRLLPNCWRPSNPMVLVPHANSSTMIEFKQIDPKGIPEKDMDPETKKIHLAMQRGVSEARKEYKRLGLSMVTADRKGNIVYKKP